MRRKWTMKHGMVIVVLLTVQVFFASCAGTRSQIPFHEVSPPDNNTVIIYVYRLPSMVGAMVPWAVRLDGKIVAVLKQKSYVVLYTSLGDHSIIIGDSEAVRLFGRSLLGRATRMAEMYAAEKQGALPRAQESDSSNATANRVYFLRSAGLSVNYVSREEAMKEIVNMRYDTGLKK